jgi:mRNA interferase RelE/StbE
MKVKYSRKFLNQLSKIPISTRNKTEQFAFNELPVISEIEQSGRIERMKGYQGYYKIRFGSYRLGLHKESNTLAVKIIIHRKDIYNYFP